MEFKPSNREDIARYYRSTYVKFKEMGDTLFFIQDVHQDRVTGTVEDGQPFTLYMSEEHPYVIEYVLPHKSFFQYNRNACMLERVPAKQYCRGLSGHNTQVVYHDGDKIRKITFGFEVLKAFVKKQKFYALSEAIQNNEGLFSAVLSPRMMYKSGYIWMDFTPIAHIKGATIEMARPVFTNEVVNFLKETGEFDKFKVIA